MKAKSRSSIYVGSLGNVSVYADVMLFPALLGLYFSGGTGIMLLILPSFFIHEASHIVIARLFDCHATSFRITSLGGVLDINMESGGIRPAQKIAVFAFAPFVNITLYAFLYAVGIRADSLVLLQLAFLNGVIALANVLPVYPLDGGNVLKTLLSVRLDERRVLNVILVINSAVTAALAVLFVCLAVNNGILIWQLPSLGFFITYSAVKEKLCSTSGKVASVFAKSSLLKKKRSLEENRIYIIKTATAGEALKLLKENRYNVFTVVDCEFGVLSYVTEKKLLNHVMESGISITMENICKAD